MCYSWQDWFNILSRSHVASAWAWTEVAGEWQIKAFVKLLNENHSLSLFIYKVKTVSFIFLPTKDLLIDGDVNDAKCGALWDKKIQAHDLLFLDIFCIFILAELNDM